VKRLRGTYALLVELDQSTVMAVGRLGSYCFPEGCYVYVGSALGSGGLAARLARHRRSDKKLHWHIDYFLRHAHIVGVETDDSGRRLECAWALALTRMPESRVIAPGFGASDCACLSHLIYVGRRIEWDERRRQIVRVTLSPHLLQGVST
jgi:Uri superfamily endonuclease